MSVIIPGWVHQQGKHCGSSALRDVSNFYGFPFSEGLCFGLGCGLGVAYLHADFMQPSHIVHLRTMTLEPDFFETLSIPFSWKQEPDSAKAFADAKKCIDEGVPVMLQTDIFHIKYYNSSTHFPGHVIVMWGYDNEKQEVYLSDTHFEGLMALSYDDLMRARKVTVPPILLDNNWCPVVFPKDMMPLEDAMRKAIQKTCREMLQSQEYPIGKKGVEAIKNVAEDLITWKDAKDGAWCLRFTYQIIEKRGTGGGGFRRLYAEFLKECADRLPELRGRNFHGRMMDIADLWTAVSEGLRRLSENGNMTQELFQSASEKFMELYNSEKTFFTELSGTLKP